MKRCLDLKVGTDIQVLTYGNVYKGKVVFIFEGGVRPNVEDVEKYYGVKPTDRKFHELSIMRAYDRVVVEYVRGKYMVFPNTREFRGEVHLPPRK